MTDALPDALPDAFWHYDRALQAITGFRAGRAVIPTRRIERVHSSVIAEDAVLLMARTRDGDATGLQTQLWRRIAARWVVAAAHVSLPAKPTHAASAGSAVPLDRTRPAVEHTAALVPAARAAGMPVIWLNWGNRPDQANIPPGVAHVYDPTGAGIGYLMPGGNPTCSSEAVGVRRWWTSCLSRTATSEWTSTG